jgi:hypothetical protein
LDFEQIIQKSIDTEIPAAEQFKSDYLTMVIDMATINKRR